jgi:hypothetical protein
MSKKGILAIIVVIAMCLTMVPFTAFAVDETVTVAATYDSVAKTVTISGTAQCSETNQVIVKITHAGSATPDSRDPVDVVDGNYSETLSWATKASNDYLVTVINQDDLTEATTNFSTNVVNTSVTVTVNYDSAAKTITISGTAGCNQVIVKITHAGSATPDSRDPVDVVDGNYSETLSWATKASNDYLVTVINQDDLSEATSSFSTYLPVTLGDINNDGKITASDALQALQCAAGKRTLTDLQKQAADINVDGKVTASDALKILQFAAGKITQF